MEDLFDCGVKDGYFEGFTLRWTLLGELFFVMFCLLDFWMRGCFELFIKSFYPSNCIIPEDNFKKGFFIFLLSYGEIFLSYKSFK